MLEALFGQKNTSWMYPFFFDGDYPLALQLGVMNALCVIAIVLMRSAQKSKNRQANLTVSRSFAWLVIAANAFLLLNKDHRFVAFLA